jgi:2-polyprenyl-3-methyl-5-hydroxy-6-metoxy-1,4-benzoquinol methylase
VKKIVIALNALYCFYGRAVKKIDKHTKWLDLGCHQGQFLELIADKFGLRPKGIDDWKSEPGADNRRWDYTHADLGVELPFDGPFDVISAFEVLEHIIDTDGFLGRIHSKLAEGGSFVLSTPNINSLRNRIMVPFGAYPNGLEYRNLVHHVRLYNKPMLERHLQATGFKDVSIFGVSFLPQRFSAGMGEVSARLGDFLPSFCNNMIAVCRK